jgi:hypothetical protein
MSASPVCRAASSQTFGLLGRVLTPVCRAASSQTFGLLGRVLIEEQFLLILSSGKL